MKNRYFVVFCSGLLGLTSPNVNGEVLPASHDSSIDTGRYLVMIAGCNDCHTANWMETNGAVAEQDWLTGVPLGWRGPWGTSYASNLRLVVADMNEEAWIAMIKTRSSLPPMPWMNVNKLTEDDARAVYRYIVSLGPSGERMPAALPPHSEPQTAFYLLEPVLPK